MGLGLGVRFELGRYHATPWATHVNDAQVEWPPSPWRILRALFSASRTDVRLAALTSDVDRALERLLAAPAPQYSLPPSTSAHTRHYVPSQKWSPTSRGETDLILDAFRAVQPEAELAVWWNADLPASERNALGRAAEVVSYLGRSESLCRMRVLEGARPETPLVRPATEQPGDGPVVDVLCPAGDSSLEQLTVTVGQLRSERRLLPPGAHWVPYRLRGAAVPDPPEGLAVRPTLALLRLTGAGRPNIREAVVIAEVVRRQLQQRYGDRTGGEASPVLSGHREGLTRTDQHRHCHYLSLPEPRGRRIDRIALWAPDGLDEDIVASLANLRRIRLRNTPDPLAVALAALGGASDMREASLLGPTTTWRTATPFALPRHPKRRGGRAIELPEEQIVRELAFRGFPAPQEIELIRGDWSSFKRTRSGGSRVRAPLAVGVRLRFPQPERGPISLGALSHFGLGLFLASGS